MVPDDKSIIEHETEALFTPVDSDDRADELPPGALAPRAPGFAGCHIAYGVKESMGGTHSFSVVAAWLDEPLHDNGPLACFELQCFYYSLGFSKSGDDLAEWLKKKPNRRKLDTLFDDLDLDTNLHLIPSRVMAITRNPSISEEQLSKDHRVEVMVSMYGALAFLLIMTKSTKEIVRDNALRLIRCLLELADMDPASELDLSDLPRCHVLHRGQCWPYEKWMG